MLSDLVLKLMTEQIYKRIMSKVLKRGLYQIIQQSVDVIYNLEEDTISMANRVLDGFILKEIDFTVCEEIIVTQDALEFESTLIE